LRLPSDPTVASDALVYRLSSRWLGDRVSFNPLARQTCRANKKGLTFVSPRDTLLIAFTLTAYRL
ncbi:hypothetical protein L7E55_04565, partial [Pelotomaculum isophthalicicum JI]